MKHLITILLGSLGFNIVAQDLNLVVPVGHTGVVQGMALSPDGKYLLSYDDRPNILVWDYDSGRQLFQLKGHNQAISGLQFHEDGTLVSIGMDGQLIRWDLKKNRSLDVVQHESALVAITASSTDLWVIDENGTLFRRTWTSLSRYDSMILDTRPAAMTSFENTILVGDWDGNLRTIDGKDLQLMRTSRISEMKVGALQYEGNYIYAGTDAGELLQVDQDLEVVRRMNPMSTRVYDIVVNEEDQVAAVAGRDGNATVKIIELENGEILHGLFQKKEFSEDQFALGSWALLGIGGKDTLLVTAPDYSMRSIAVKDAQMIKEYTGFAHPVNDLSISYSNKLALGSSRGVLKQIDLTGASSVQSSGWADGGVRSLSYHPLVDKLVSVGDDGIIRVSNDEVIAKFNAQPRYLSTPVRFDPTGQFILRKNDLKYLDVYDYLDKKERKIKSKDGFGFQFSSDGSKILIRTAEGITFYETGTLKKSEEVSIKNIQDFDTWRDGFYVLLRDDKTLQEFDYKGRRKRSFATENLVADKIIVDPSGSYAYTYQTTVAKGQLERDYRITKVDLASGEVLGRLLGHEGLITGIEFFGNGEFLFTSSLDGRINIYPLESNRKPAASLISLGQKDFVVTTPDGLFDATPGAMKSLHYEKNGSLISLDQFKNSLYEPNLLPRILGLIDDPLPNRAMGQILPHPEMNITHPNLNDGVLGIEVEDNGGGIGEIVIIINGKEVSRDVRNVAVQESGSVELQYQISGHPYLKGDGIDRVVIKAYNKDGSMSTSERSISVFPDSKLSQIKPKLYAVIAGTSDYGGEALDLAYAAKDAEDFAKVLQRSAANQFGEDHVEIALLTTNEEDRSMWPLKRNLDSVFNAFGERARAVDYLIVYLSGHGVNDGDFYYLTADASDPVLEDRDKASVAISSLELTTMIQKVAALKQVLVLDACHSGRFANDLIQSESIPVMEAERIKAMERMKDRMGMYVLAGSKADAVSYEADLFDQGLLTYSILFGMKGAASENEAVDVIDLFQYVQSKVPELAADIGGIQRPEVRYPVNAESFSLGQLSQSERDDIKLVQPKPIFTISSFQEEKQYLDVMQIGKMVDDNLQTLASGGGEIVFVRKSSFSDAYHIKGRYNVTQEKISVKGRLYKGEERISDFNLESNDPEDLVLQIIADIVRQL